MKRKKILNNPYPQKDNIHFSYHHHSQYISVKNRADLLTKCIANVSKS